MSKNNSIVINLDAVYYPKEAVVSTCCQFLANNYVFLERTGNSNNIKVTLTPKEAGTSKTLKATKAVFENELMNNTLRHNIAQRNKDLREYIIKNALVFSQSTDATAGSALSDLEQDAASAKKYLASEGDDWKEDPLGIAVPWDDKKKKKSKAKKKKC